MNRDPGDGWRRREWLLAALAALGGCGGVDSGGTGTGDRSTLAVGAIAGLGSIIVNGVRYDESQAEVDDDEGNRRSREELRLGMCTEVLASAVDVQGGAATATASAVRIRSHLRGPIEAIDLASRRLQVFGQRVDLAATTVVDGGLDSLAINDVVEVHGTLDLAARRYVATRIESQPGTGTYKVRAAVGSLDLAGRTVDIGGLRISWGAVAPADPATALGPGRLVQVLLSTTPAAGVWSAVRLEPDAAVRQDRESAEVEGRVTAFTSVTVFELNGIPVDASGADVAGGGAGLVLGAKVEVLGRIQDGVLFATRVELEDDDGDDEAFELHGSIDAVDMALMQFVVRGSTVVWTGATRFDSSSALDLVVGRRVEVRGRLASDGTRIEATRVHVEL